MPITLLVSLSDLSPIVGATVHAGVVSPSMTHREMILYDDGEHGDGTAGDGVYGNRFIQTHEPGSYIVGILAEGSSNLGEAFVRRARGAFHIEEAMDSDGDGLPDEYEEQNGSDPSSPDDGSDFDLDGLTLLEEYNAGTDPRAADTDYGGEADGSEVGRGSNPMDAGDDMISSHGELYVTPGNGYNILVFESLPEYHTALIFRSFSEYGEYSVVAETPATGRHQDMGLTNGQTYWYKVMLQDGFGRRTAPTDPVPGTPKADPVPPGGWISINNDAERTYLRDVMLTLYSLDDAEFDFPTEWIGDRANIPAAEMRISNERNLEGAQWEPFMEERAWTLAVAEGYTNVYAQFRDAELNVSEIEKDSILVVPVQPIESDIRPGSSNNCININNHGIIPVVIFGSAEFDVSQIDTFSLALENMPVRLGGNGRPLCTQKDSNRDRNMDLMCHFEKSPFGLGWNDDTGTVIGYLFNGVRFQGSDSICVVPPLDNQL